MAIEEIIDEEHGVTLDSLLKNKRFLRLYDNQECASYTDGKDYFCDYRQAKIYLSGFSTKEFKEINPHLEFKYNSSHKNLPWLREPSTQVGFVLPSYFLSGVLASVSEYYLHFPTYMVIGSLIIIPAVGMYEAYKILNAENAKNKAADRILKKFKDRTYFGKRAIDMLRT